jgi:hypothetical protein
MHHRCFQPLAQQQQQQQQLAILGRHLQPGPLLLLLLMEKMVAK